MGRNARLGRFVALQDVYGNVFTYAHLAKVAATYPAPRPRRVTRASIASELKLPKADPKPTAAASDSARRGPGQARPRQAARRSSAPRPSRRRRPRSARSACSRTPPARLPARPAARSSSPRPPTSPRRRAAAAQPPRLHGQAAAQGRARDRRHDPRPHRQDLEARRTASAVRDPPGRPRRPAHRPEADPRRLEAARVDRDLPRRRQEPVLRPRRQDALDRADPADEQGGAAAPGARQPAHRDLRLRPPRRPRRRDRPPRARHAGVPRRLGPEADGHLAAVRPRLLHRQRQRLRALLRQRRRHRRRQRHPDHRPPGRGLDHRDDDPAPADAAGHDEAAPDHLA